MLVPESNVASTQSSPTLILTHRPVTGVNNQNGPLLDNRAHSAPVRSPFKKVNVNSSALKTYTTSQSITSQRPPIYQGNPAQSPLKNRKIIPVKSQLWASRPFSSPVQHPAKSHIFDRRPQSSSSPQKITTLDNLNCPPKKGLTMVVPLPMLGTPSKPWRQPNTQQITPPLRWQLNGAVLRTPLLSANDPFVFTPSPTNGIGSVKVIFPPIDS